LRADTIDRQGLLDQLQVELLDGEPDVMHPDDLAVHRVVNVPWKGLSIDPFGVQAPVVDELGRRNFSMG
jgi:hypothetical protein